MAAISKESFKNNLISQPSTSTDISSVNVKDFGAIGDGETDDTAAIQAAIGSLYNSGGNVLFPTGIYAISRNKGIHDRWGLKLDRSNIALIGEQGAKFIRKDDIIADEDAYPILFIGVPDSNKTVNQTRNILIHNLWFEGNDVRHSVYGSSMPDFRTALELRNLVDVTITNTRFTKIDSSAIYCKPIWAGQIYRNTTKVYNLKVKDCFFIAEPHSIFGRSLLHAITLSGVDHFNATGNYFEWCDNAISGSGTYETAFQKETDLWRDPTSEINKPRAGRDWIIEGNVFFNSSEHSVYLNGSDIVFTSNTVRNDQPDVCLGDAKFRGKNCAIMGNQVTASESCITISCGAENISITGNCLRRLKVSSTSGGGTIEISEFGLYKYIKKRPFFKSLRPFGPITITGNTIEHPNRPESHGFAIRIYADTDIGSFTDYTVHGINISGNTINYAKVGILILGHTHAYNLISVTGNAFSGKTFNRSDFDNNTQMDSFAVIGVSTSQKYTLMKVAFRDNVCIGFANVFATASGSGTGSGIHLPNGITNNTFNFIQNIGTPGMRRPDRTNTFSGNRGGYFLDRNFSSTMINNALRGGSNTSSKSINRQSFEFSNEKLIFYTDDNGNKINLN